MTYNQISETIDEIINNESICKYIIVQNKNFISIELVHPLSKYFPMNIIKLDIIDREAESIIKFINITKKEMYNNLKKYLEEISYEYTRYASIEKTLLFYNEKNDNTSVTNNFNTEND